MRHNAHATEIQPIGIPAGADRRLVLGVAVAVEPHRLAQLLERTGVELGDCALPPQANGKVRGAAAVASIDAVIVALAVVQEGKPCDDARIDVERTRERTTVDPNATPVRDAVDAVVEVEPELRPHHRDGLLHDRDAGGVHARTVANRRFWVTRSQ